MAVFKIDLMLTLDVSLMEIMQMTGGAHPIYYIHKNRTRPQDFEKFGPSMCFFKTRVGVHASLPHHSVLISDASLHYHSIFILGTLAKQDFLLVIEL